MTPQDGAEASQWHRMHPLTPLVRSWQVLVGLLVLAGQWTGQNAIEGGGSGVLDALSRSGSGRWLAGGGAVLVAVLAVATGLAVLSWRMSRYRIDEEALELYSGVLFRRHRRARLDRLQAVDVVQPFIARLVGLARLDVEVAGGGNSKITLSYLTESQARSLRNHLLARAAGVRYDTPEAPEAPEHQVLAVTIGRLVGSLLLSGAAVSMALALVGLLTAALAFGTLAPAVGVVPAALGLVGALWARFSGGFNFRVATSPDGLRLRHGLLEHRSQTLPPGRVQAIELSQPLLWRRPDWWSARVNVAGYGVGGEQDAGSGSVLLPVGTRAEAVQVLALLVPDLGTSDEERAHDVALAGLYGSGADGQFTTSPRAARWVDLLAWRRTGFRATGTVLLLRRGALLRRLAVVPHERTQSCGVQQGPLQRRLGLATFALHSTPGPVTPRVSHLASADAARLLDQQAVRAQAARTAAGPERWMERAGSDAAPAQVSSPTGSTPTPGSASAS